MTLGAYPQGASSRHKGFWVQITRSPYRKTHSSFKCACPGPVRGAILMTLARLWTRLLRLEAQASQIRWYTSDMAQVLAWVAEAGLQAGLAAALREDLCAAIRQVLQALAPPPHRSLTEA